MTIMNADYIIHSPTGRFVVAVQVKNQKGLTTPQAVEMRQEMAKNGWLPAADFLLIITQDRGFLWARQLSLPPDAPPSLEFPSAPIVHKYVPSLAPDERLRNAELDLIVRAWLNEISMTSSVDDPTERALKNIGFLDALHGGTWIWETA